MGDVHNSGTEPTNSLEWRGGLKVSTAVGEASVRDRSPLSQRLARTHAEGSTLFDVLLPPPRLMNRLDYGQSFFPSYPRRTNDERTKCLIVGFRYLQGNRTCCVDL